MRVQRWRLGGLRQVCCHPAAVSLRQSLWARGLTDDLPGPGLVEEIRSGGGQPVAVLTLSHLSRLRGRCS